MTAIAGRGEIGADHTLRVAVPCGLPPGTVDVVVQVPTVDDIPLDLAEMLDEMKHFSDEELWRAGRQRVPAEVGRRIHDLQYDRGVRGLSTAEAEELTGLLHQCDRTMLIRAEAAALLHGRGRDVSGLLSP